MITKTVTLKFTNKPHETVVIPTDNEKTFQKEIEALMDQTGAYGFSTQSTVHHMATR